MSSEGLPSLRRAGNQARGCRKQNGDTLCAPAHALPARRCGGKRLASGDCGKRHQGCEPKTPHLFARLRVSARLRDAPGQLADSPLLP